jgi:hypothetical protein
VKNFSPHAILRSPLTSDEEVERLIELVLTLRRQASTNEEGPVVMIIEPPLEFWGGEPSSHGSWPVFEKPA